MAEIFTWVDSGRRWSVPYDEIGRGPLALCLPAPSTISTREELRGLAERLAVNRRVILVDWPGLGEADRAPIRYRASLYSRFLASFAARFSEPVSVVAAGHAASYVLATPMNRFAGAALLAPTWRGPVPTVPGSLAFYDEYPDEAAAAVRRFFDASAVELHHSSAETRDIS